MIAAPYALLVLAAAAVFALLSRRIETWPVTLPMVFTGLGLGLAALGLDLGSVEDAAAPIHLVAEVTLVIVLFADASQVRLSALRQSAAIPTRMLLIGMPLVLLIGTPIAKWVSPEESWALALLVAALLAPTDAALGRAAVTNPAVPKRVRRSLNVESGLNDGLMVPVVLVSAVVAARVAGASGEDAPGNIALFALLQITLGPLIGAAVGWVGARLMDAAVARNAATRVAQGTYFLTIAGIAFFGAEAIGGNGLIAAFVGGLAFGNTLKCSSAFVAEFMEGEGQLLTMATFLVFGAVLAPLGLEHAGWKTLVLAVAYLTVGRMVPIWLSLAGTDLTAYERLYIGWFGARGLASILFALLVLERFDLPHTDEIVACVALTVMGSIVLHGISAPFLSNRFATADSSAGPSFDDPALGDDLPRPMS